MPQSPFFSRSSSSRDSNPLLPLHHSPTRTSSFDLQDLSPRASQGVASPSPPPSFYRAKNRNSSRTRNESKDSTRAPTFPYHDSPRPFQLSPSPSPSPQRRRIQFAAPPPPITSSVLLPVPRTEDEGVESSRWGRGSPGAGRTPRLVRGNSNTDPLLVLERKERGIQRELQGLLDAQSAGLIHGFGGEGSEGSCTPTGRSVLRDGSRSESMNGKGKGIVPVRQPKRRTVGLRAARRGLLRDLGELVSVKDEETSILNAEIGRREEVLQKVEVWEQRIEGARRQLSGAVVDQAEGVEDANELAELRTEERAVDNEIREVEDRLAQMKARKRWLGERISEGVNRQEARLSSYRGALREAELEVKQFLKRPPVVVSAIMGEDGGFMALPSGRRTLGMAREWWNKEVSQLKTRREEVEKEKLALEEGARLWQDSVQVVTEFEDDLRKQMSTASDPSSMQSQIADNMASVIAKLSESVATAEERGWNLLICALGAELAAFKEGEGLLRGSIGTTSNVDTEEKREEELKSESNGLEELNGQGGEREDSEDDGPNLAELLVESGH